MLNPKSVHPSPELTQLLLIIKEKFISSEAMVVLVIPDVLSTIFMLLMSKPLNGKDWNPEELPLTPEEVTLPQSWVNRINWQSMVVGVSVPNSQT